LFTRDEAKDFYKAVRAKSLPAKGELLSEKDLQRVLNKTSADISRLQKQMNELVQSEVQKEFLRRIEAGREAYRGPRADLVKRKAAGEDVAQALQTQLLPLAEAYLKTMSDLLVQLHTLDQLVKGRMAGTADAAEGTLAVLNSVVSGASDDLGATVTAIAGQQRAAGLQAARQLLDASTEASLAARASIANAALTFDAVCDSARRMASTAASIRSDCSSEDTTRASSLWSQWPRRQYIHSAPAWLADAADCLRES
jgi:hypothetical protein